MKKIVFITGTRADYGKIKSVMKVLNESEHFHVDIFVTGMHLIEKFGSTVIEVQKDALGTIFCDEGHDADAPMDAALANIISSFSAFVKKSLPDMIVVHGDRFDALAGALVGACNNVLVAHIEGGEVSGTIDESIRHSISKFAHLHFVANQEARKRLVQLGEYPHNIFVIGSPDIDIMLNAPLSSIEDVKKYYEVPYDEFAILLYHSVVTEHDKTKEHTQCLVDALIESKRNYLVIYPNNDLGHDDILAAYDNFSNIPNFRIIPSLRFESFLSLLNHAQFIIGNSSTGVREAAIYGVLSIDIGSRQQARYDPNILKNIIHAEHHKEDILAAIAQSERYERIVNMHYGAGDSAHAFFDILMNSEVWEISKQKVFIDIDF